MLSIFTPDTLHHLMQSYGLWLLFSVIMLESMGLPLPGETLLVTAALYAATEHGFSIYAVIGVAALAAVVGDNLGYLIGRSVGWPLLHRYGKYVHLTAARLRVGQYLFQQHGGKIVFFGRFVAFLRAFAALLAGANRMHWSHFLWPLLLCGAEGQQHLALVVARLLPLDVLLLGPAVEKVLCLEEVVFIQRFVALQLSGQCAGEFGGDAVFELTLTVIEGVAVVPKLLQIPVVEVFDHRRRCAGVSHGGVEQQGGQWRIREVQKP